MQIINNPIVLILISSLCMGLAQHSLNMGFLAWFSLVPFFIVINNISSYSKAIKYFFFWGVVYHLTSLFWLASNVGTDRISAAVSMIATILYLSTNTIIIGVIWYRLKSYFNNYSIFILVIVWTCVEFIKSYGLLAFPWISIANTQIDYFYLIQNAEFVGIYGITFWVVLLNGLIFRLVENNFKYNFYLPLLIVFIIPHIFGYFIYTNLDESYDDYQISMIQPNIKLSDSRDYSKRYTLLDDLIVSSKEAMDNKSKLIIWPEAALPFHTLQDENTFTYIKDKLLKDNNVSILSGDLTYELDKTYNSVVLFNKDGIQNIYRKKYPVPLAEQVPLSDVFPKLKKINIGVANYSSGKENVIFNIDDQNFSSLICYESTFPDINREHVNEGADFITFLVNDAWYTTWPEPEQHAKQSIYRAIENRRSVLRCANTGISLVVDPSGEVRMRTNLNEEAIITTNIKKTNYTTFYTKFGNVFVYILLVMMISLLIKTFIRNEKTV